MKQKRKVKSLLPKKFCLDGRILTVLLLVLSLVLCLGSVSLLTHSVKAAGTSVMEIQSIPYTGIDNKVEVLYNMQFVDPSNLEKVVNNLYMSGESLYISPNTVVISGDNVVGTGIYSHILGGMENEIYSNSVTIIAGKNNIVRTKNNNASILGGVGNEIGTGFAYNVPIPGVFVGGSGNKANHGDRGAVLIGGHDNRIESNTSYKGTFLLGGYQNYSKSKNTILGGHDITNTQHNVFVYSNYPGSGGIIFEPLSSNAFYLHVISGAGINTEGIEGLSVGGAVSIGGVWHYTCMNYALGEMMNYSGCLVGCTDEGAAIGKWEMLDKGDRCAEICRNHNAWCFMSSDEIDVNDYTAQCTKGVNTGNAHLCVSGELGKYKNVLFETSLIDSDEECNLTQDICMYQCNQGTHLTGAGTNRRCYSDCSYTRIDGTEVRDIKHGEFITGYNVGEVMCENNGAGDICSNHVKSLFCNDGSMRIGSMDGETVELRQYYKQCVMSGYICPDDYNLTYNDIITIYQEEGFATGSLKGGDTVTGTRGIYDVCINFGGGNMDSCTTGDQKFRFKDCMSGYSLVDGICRKDCDSTHPHGSTGMFYKSSSATCTGTCEGREFTCYDGIRTGEDKAQYMSSHCTLNSYLCNTGVYNVTYEEYLTGLYTSIYECCTGYVASGNTQCTLGDTVCKLVGCIEGYHTGDNGKFCVDNTMHCLPPEPYESGPVGLGVIKGPGTYQYNNVPDPDYWNYVDTDSPGACQWSCAPGYVFNGDYGCEEEIGTICGGADGGTYGSVEEFEDNVCDNLNGGVLSGDITVNDDGTKWIWLCKNTNGGEDQWCEANRQCGGEEVCTCVSDDLVLSSDKEKCIFNDYKACVVREAREWSTTAIGNCLYTTCFGRSVSPILPQIPEFPCEYEDLIYDDKGMYGSEADAWVRYTYTSPYTYGITSINNAFYFDNRFPLPDFREDAMDIIQEDYYLVHADEYGVEDGGYYIRVKPGKTAYSEDSICSTTSVCTCPGDYESVCVGNGGTWNLTDCSCTCPDGTKNKDGACVSCNNTYQNECQSSGGTRDSGECACICIEEETYNLAVAASLSDIQAMLPDVAKPGIAEAFCVPYFENDHPIAGGQVNYSCIDNSDWSYFVPPSPASPGDFSCDCTLQYRSDSGCYGIARG